MKTNLPTPFGEIIESTLTEWKVACWHRDIAPAFASPVVAQRGDTTIFGIIIGMQTGSIEPGRSPFAFQKTEEELMRDQPHIFSLLQTTCRCIVLGYRQHEKTYYQIPAHPPKIHAFVRPASDRELQLFFAHTAYAHMLLNNEALALSGGEIMLALFKHLHEKNLLTERHIHQCAHLFSMLSGNDYRTLKLFLQRVEHMLSVRTAVIPAAIEQTDSI